jgi:hypothetical protein
MLFARKLGRDGTLLVGRRIHYHEASESYIERVLAPELRPGQIVMMDNMMDNSLTHRDSRTKQLIA